MNRTRRSWLTICFVFPIATLAGACATGPDGDREPIDEAAREVIGGQEAAVGEYPWQAHLRVPGYSHWCGGSLINEYWVLTAAHCVAGFSPSQVTVSLGEHNRTVAEGREQTRQAARLIVHPNWNASTLQNDVALIELNGPVARNAWVQPVRLASTDYSVGTSAVVTGWGNTSPGSGAPAVLREATLPIVDNATCDADPRLTPPIVGSMLCAGFSNGLQGGCHGDSGGPLVVQASDGAREQVGIVSWGQPDFCSTFTVFSRVPFFKAWVDSTIAQTPKPLEELYVSRGNVLWAVDGQTGARYARNADQPHMKIMASTGGYLYGVIGDGFYRINPDPTNDWLDGGYVLLGSGWQGSEAMAALSNQVYTVWGGELFRTNGSTGATVSLGGGWANIEALAAGHFLGTPYVFGVQGGVLWMTNGNTGASISMGADWGGTEAMTFGNGYVFAVHGDVLWRVSVPSGASVAIEGYGWSGTEAMTFRDGQIYAVQGGQLWRTSPNGGSTSLGAGWEGTFAMAAR